MLGKDIERKITVFISSKIDERYKLVRYALKTLLMETGLVASVYAFEQEASSQNTQGAYLSEVSQSDLCIFLIDNADGVSDAVYKEHKQAINTGIHRLYFFCDERIKDEIPLHSELRQSGKTIYRTIHEFAEIPKVAYERALQDLLDWYRKRADNLDLDIDITSDIQHTVEANTFQASLSITLDKNVFARYSSNNILVRVLNPYVEKLFTNEKDSSTLYDNLCADLLRMVIGYKSFSIDVFNQLKDTVLSEPMAINDIRDVLRIRFDAIAEYFSGNLDACLTNLCDAYELIKSNQSVPEWLANDIAIDMRNISNMLDETKNQIQFYSKGQEILNQSSETVYYPLLDRFAENQKSKLLNEHFEMLTESPYTNRVGIMSGAFDDIASCFNIAVRFGSLTNIRITRDRYAEVLFTKYVDCKDVRLFRELVRMYILEQNGKSLGKVVKAYRNSVDAMTVDDIEVIIKSIETVPLKHKRFESVCLLLEYFGYYMSDEQYKKQVDIFFAQSNAWCEHGDSRIFTTGYFILRTALKIMGRSDNMLLLELALSFFSKGIWRFCDETLKILKHIDYAKCEEKTQKRVMEQLIALLAMGNLKGNNQLNNAIIAYRKIANIDTSALDSAVKENNPDFYSGVYDLEIGLDNNPQVHLDKYIKEARQRIRLYESGVYYTSYLYDPYEIIRNILKEESIRLETDKISEMVTLIQDTILNDNQSDVKEGALLLAIYLRNTYPDYGAWEQFSELIMTHEAEIRNVRFNSFFGGSSPNVIQCCYLLLKISLGSTSFEEVAIGFATMSSYSECDFISTLIYLSKYLSDADIDMIDNGILGIILNFVLSVGEDKHSDALYYAIVALIELLNAKSYADAALIRLSYLMVNANCDLKVLILRKVSKMPYIKTDIGQHILQNGRTNNHYFVKKLANEITQSVMNNTF